MENRQTSFDVYKATGGMLTREQWERHRDNVLPYKEMKPVNYPEDVRVPFGAFQDQTLGDVLEDQPSYLDWLASIEIKSPDFREAVRAMCAKYASDIAKAIDPSGAMLPSRAKVYVLEQGNGEWILTKEHHHRFRMGKDEADAVDRAVTVAESEYAKLLIKR